jgi:hypothetical protein
MTYRDISTLAPIYTHRPMPASTTAVAQVSASQPNEALRGPQRAKEPTRGLWDVATAYRRYGDAVMRAGAK